MLEEESPRQGPIKAGLWFEDNNRPRIAADMPGMIREELRSHGTQIIVAANVRILP